MSFSIQETTLKSHCFLYNESTFSFYSFSFLLSLFLFHFLFLSPYENWLWLICSQEHTKVLWMAGVFLSMPPFSHRSLAFSLPGSTHIFLKTNILVLKSKEISALHFCLTSHTLLLTIPKHRWKTGLDSSTLDYFTRSLPFKYFDLFFWKEIFPFRDLPSLLPTYSPPLRMVICESYHLGSLSPLVMQGKKETATWDSPECTHGKEKLFT